MRFVINSLYQEYHALYDRCVLISLGYWVGVRHHGGFIHIRLYSQSGFPAHGISFRTALIILCLMVRSF